MLYAFDGYELDMAKQELRQAGVPVSLASKVQQVLAYLLQHRDRVVFKQELLEQIWPDTYVDDSAVKRCIMAARRAIGDTSNAPQCIKTLRGQGYRFIATVIVQEPRSSLAAATVSSLPVPQIAVLPEQEAHQPGKPSAEGAASGGLTCPSCGQKVQLPAMFCCMCGQRLGVVQAPEPRSALPTASPQPHPTAQHVPLGERKLVTALCCPVVNAPALVEGLGLDATHSLMQAIYSMALDEIQCYNGTLQYVTSTGLLVLFGAPVAQEDHARRAVLTALGLQQRLRQSQPVLPSGTELEVGMALHTGLVILGQLSTDAYRLATVVGETPVLAATLAQRTAPGTLIASEATIQLVQGEVRTVALPPCAADDPATRVPVYQILQFVPQRLLLAVSEGRPCSPFVGREAELAVLCARLAFVERGQGQVVSIRGEPGMGKSRLLFEFRRGLTTRRVNYVQGRCQSYGHTMPYLPMRDLLRATLGLAEADSDTVIRARIEASLQEMGMAAAPWAPYFLHLLGVGALPAPAAGLSPESVKERTFEALHHLLYHRSRQQPCVVEIEDLHWIDATSEAYLAALVERLTGIPLLLLVTARPGYRPPWLDKSHVTQIALQPLGPDESRQVVRATLSRTPLAPAAEQALLAKAEGNPFFLEELARTVVAQGGRTSMRQVPDTIQAVIAARLDHLPSEEKQLLQTAAVFGAAVPLAVLQIMTSLSEEALRRSLTHLQTVEFLYETRFLGESTYTFKHILTHEIAYASLHQEQRMVLHARVVEALERFYPDRLQAWTEGLAYHALHGGVWDKAYNYFRQAGSSAMARSAHREAVACLEQALVALQHLPECRDTIEQAIDLRFSLRGVLLQLGEFERVLTYLQEAEALAQRLDDPHRLGRIASYRARYCFLMGEHEAALHAGQRALSLAVTLSDVSLEVAGNMYLGQVYHALGDYPQALDVLRRNVALLVGPLLHERLGMANLPAVTSRTYLAFCLAELGQFDAGMACGEEGMRLAEEAEHANSLAIACLGLGRLHLNQGAFGPAMTVLERGLTLCDKAHIALLRPAIAAALGYAYVLAGRSVEALPLLRQVQQTAPLPTPLSSLVVTWLSEISLLNGHVEEAGAFARQALALAQDRKERGNQAWTLRLLGALAMHAAANLAQAQDCYEQALVLAEALSMRPLLAHCHFALGTLACRLGRRAQAHAECSTAVTLFRSLHMTLWLAQAENALAQVS